LLRRRWQAAEQTISVHVSNFSFHHNDIGIKM
jgi:hypothetical protein